MYWPLTVDVIIVLFRLKGYHLYMLNFGILYESRFTELKVTTEFLFPNTCFHSNASEIKNQIRKSLVTKCTEPLVPPNC